VADKAQPEQAGRRGQGGPGGRGGQSGELAPRARPTQRHGPKVEQDEGSLPASIATAWGLRERPAKGPKRGLSLDQIVRAGLTVAASDGLAAVSMARVAAELGVGTMSLYRYVTSKSELLQLMVDAGLGPPPQAEAGASWRDGLAGWAWAQLAAYRRQLWAVQVPLPGPPTTPNALRWVEQALSCMRGTRLDESQKMSVILLVSSYVRNQATMEAQIDAAARAASHGTGDLMAEYGKLLSSLLDERRFPELSRVAAAGVLAKADPWDDEFAFGLDRILDGIEVLVTGLARDG
jgi:AcrR family transcriptional regulator